ncbi:MAG: LPS export ABC transporter periplasmic protein LptC [Asticcacaulis sp.]
MTPTDLHTPLEPLGTAYVDIAAEAADRRVRLAQQAAAVRRRSRMIRQLRILIPAAIIGLGLLNVGWIAVQTMLNSFNVYNAASNEVRMTNPRYFGQSSNGDHYTISGLEAVRKGANATFITLKAPTMELRDAEGGRPSKIKASNGVFNQLNNKFTMTGNVVMETGTSDFTLKTEEAIVDLQNSSVSGDKHVEGNGSVGHIEGESFIISDNGNHILFRGKGPVQVKAVKY